MWHNIPKPSGAAANLRKGTVSETTTTPLKRAGRIRSRNLHSDGKRGYDDEKRRCYF